ncbi:MULTISPECIES: putative Ig domain-containing protein [Pseudanabaena]
MTTTVPTFIILFAMPSTPFLTTDTDWQDGHDGLDGLDSDIALICNNHLDIFPHPFLFRTTDVNEAPTALVLSNNTTPENVVANSLIGTFTSTDPDTTPQTFTYSLVTGTGSTDNAAFTIVNNELRIVNSPNFEAKNSYSIRVRTTDQGGLSYEKVFTVNILNVNEAPTLSAIANQTIASGTLLSVNAIATDPDQPTNLTYSLEPNAPTGASINPITGVFTWTPTVSQAGTYTIGIRVTDDGNPSLSDFKTFQTVVINPNLAPTDLALNPSSIAENVPVNTEVGSFSSIDPDTGNSFTYSLVNGIGDINNNLFTIENGKLKLNFSPDFESKSSYSIRVKTTDQGGLSFEKALIISITDVNEAPTALVLSNNTTPENVTANTLIGKFTSTDPDSTPQTFTYSLVAGTGSSDNTSFSIINNELHIVNSPDFETNNSYSIRVKTTDQGGLSYEKVFTVNITNINESPVFTSDTKNNGSAGQPYQYNITTSDPENNSLDITAVNLPSWLTLVDNHDGTAKLQGTPSFTDSGIYNIQLKARENSTFEHLEANQNFYISVDLSLKEQSFFSPIRSIPITIPSQPSILQFKIDGLNFDTAALNSIHDAFEVSLVDSNGKPLTLTIGAGRSSFFNLSESNTPALTAATTYDPITGIVKLNLTGIPANTSANLVFRLINDDADTTTQVTIKDFTIVNAPLNTLPAQQTVLPASPSPTPLNLGNTIDVSSSILPQYDRTSFNQDSKLLYASLALKNSGTYAVNNPLLVAVTNISDPTVQVRNTNGFTPDGLPYYDFSALVNDGKLNQGQITEIGNLIFYNPNQVQFTYKLQVLSTLNKPPVITSQPNSEVIGGKTYTYNVKATDPDSDNLTYKLLVNPDGMTINSQTGVITWVTTTADIGNKSISVEVSDGRGGVSKQDYNLAVTDIPPNRPPAFVTNPVVQAYINKLYQYDSQAIDPDQDSLTYSVVIGPDGLKVDPATGKVEWTAPPSLILGDTVIGQINVPGQNQEFNFSGKAGQKFYFDPLQYTGSRENWRFQIYSPSGQLVANEYLAYYDTPFLSLNEDGNYKIVINPSGDTVGSYGFRVVNPALLPITNFDKVINDTLNLGSQDNLYRFTASKGQKLYFDMQSRAYDKMDWVLYDPRNVAIAANGYMDDMEVDIQTDGEYVLAIRGRDALTTSNSYAFSIINSPLPVTPMTLGTTVSGNLKKGEQDTFTFTGTAGQQLFFDSLVHPYNSSYFIAYIYDPSGVQVDTFDSRSDRTPDNAGLRLTSDGTYKIKIDGSGENNGAYAFRLLDKAAATPIALDTEFSGTLGNGGYNIELFQFELTSRQYLYFDTTSLGYDNYYPAYYNAQPGGWQLYDTSGQLYYSQRLWEDREGWLEAGKYTLAILGYGAGYESRYKFNLVTPELTTKPAITFGSDVSGTLNEKGAQDYYTFTGTAGQLLYFDSLSNNPNNLSIIVYDPTGREVVRTNSRSDLNPSDSAALRLTMNGTYRITVDGDGEAIGNYKFRLLNKADSPLVALDTDIVGTFDNDNLGSVGYRFNIPTQTYVYIDGQQGNGYWYIYNASGQRITGTGTNNDQELWLGAGEYWLVAQGYGYGDSNYKLRIITPDLIYNNITLNTALHK